MMALFCCDLGNFCLKNKEEFMEKNRKNRRKLNSRFLALLLSFVMVAATLYGDYSIASAVKLIRQ